MDLFMRMLAAIFTRSGPSDWVIQRITSVVITAYLVFIVGYLTSQSNLSYEQWSALNQLTSVRLFTLITMLSIALHAWIGIWCVLTDYVTVRLIGLKADIIRTTLQYALGGVTAAYFLWTVKILWGI